MSINKITMKKRKIPTTNTQRTIQSERGEKWRSMCGVKDSIVSLVFLA